MNYNDLVAQIINFANRDVDDRRFNFSIPTFVENAQSRIWRESKDLGFETLTIMGGFEKNNPLIRKPQNWNKTLSIRVFSRKDLSQCYFLEPHTYEYCIGVWPNSNQGNDNNPPLYYADYPLKESKNEISNLNQTPYGGWFIAPTPSQELQYEVNYTVFTQNIDKTHQQNILSIRYPDLLFYACMCEAFNFTQELNILQSMEALYQKALTSVNAQTQDRYSDRTSNRRIN